MDGRCVSCLAPAIRARRAYARCVRGVHEWTCKRTETDVKPKKLLLSISLSVEYQTIGAVCPAPADAVNMGGISMEFDVF